MWRRVVTGVWLVVAGCGGNVEGGQKDPEGGDRAPDVATNSQDDQLGGENPDADTDLGSCELGPIETYSSPEPCAWVAEKRCYSSREMACNCACPRSRNSQCASGFEDGPDGHVWVACN